MDGNKKARMKRAQRMALRNGRQDRVFTGTYEEVNHADMDAGDLTGHEQLPKLLIAGNAGRAIVEARATTWEGEHWCTTRDFKI